MRAVLGERVTSCTRLLTARPELLLGLSDASGGAPLTARRGGLGPAAHGARAPPARPAQGPGDPGECERAQPPRRGEGACPSRWVGRGLPLRFPRVHWARWLSGHVSGPRRSVSAELSPSSVPGSGLPCLRHEHLPPHRGPVPPGGHHHPAAQDLEDPLLRRCVPGGTARTWGSGQRGLIRPGRTGPD